MHIWKVLHNGCFILRNAFIVLCNHGQWLCNIVHCILCCAIFGKSLYFCTMSWNGCTKVICFASVCAYAQYCTMVAQSSKAIFNVALQCPLVAQCFTTLQKGCTFLHCFNSQVRERKFCKKHNHCAVSRNITQPLDNNAQH